MAEAFSDQRRIESETIRKVGIRLVPFLVVCYFIAYVDRVNVGFAEVSLPLTAEVLSVLAGPEPVRLWFHAPTTVPKDAGKGDDTRALGVGVDWVSLE